MIPDFKTFIEESLWSEIQDRSCGKAIRKEDDINILDLDEFYEYIKEHYKANVEYYAMGGGSGAAIGVDITEDILLLYKPKRGYILLSWSRVVIPIPFLDELAERYKIENPNTMRRIITEKDGSCTNKTFVDVIEFFFKYKKYMMNESLWSEIQDRSCGKARRKEDDINLLDMSGLLDYIQNKYKFGKDFMTLSSSFGIPLFSYNYDTTYLTISFSVAREGIYSVYSRLFFDSPFKDSITSMLKQKYLIKIKKEDPISRYNDSGFYLINIEPKKGDTDNKFVMDVIETYIDIIDTFKDKDINKYIKRK